MSLIREDWCGLIWNILVIFLVNVKWLESLTEAEKQALLQEVEEEKSRWLEEGHTQLQLL
ncbi:hypothetical protein JHK87_047388 [Glycine soja]|nr:hypothetical protein JHK87_047388 [Glycine soja]